MLLPAVRARTTGCTCLIYLLIGRPVTLILSALCLQDPELIAAILTDPAFSQVGLEATASLHCIPQALRRTHPALMCIDNAHDGHASGRLYIRVPLCERELEE